MGTLFFSCSVLHILSCVHQIAVISSVFALTTQCTRVQLQRHTFELRILLGHSTSFRIICTGTAGICFVM